MSDEQQNGMCAAFGCPLLGTVKSGTTGEGEWYCPCHFNRSPAVNDAITAKLNANRNIAAAILDIRQFSGTDEWPVVYRGIQKLLIDAERKDLLCGDVDRYESRDKPSIGKWLQRLEQTLIELTREVGQQQRLPLAKPAAGIIGPTHAATFFGDVGS